MSLSEQVHTHEAKPDAGPHKEMSCFHNPLNVIVY